MTPEEAIVRHVLNWAGKDEKAPKIKPFRDNHHAGIVFEPKERLGRDIVLLPGWTSMGEGMGKLGYLLARKGFRVHLLYLPGMGGPERERYTLKTIIDYVKSYLERVGIRNPVFVGHSMSGEVVKHLARKLGGTAVSLAPAGPRGWRRIVDWVVAPVGVWLAKKKAKEMGIDPSYYRAHAILSYMKVVGAFGGWDAHISLGIRDRLVPLTDEFYLFKRGVRTKGLLVWRGDHHFFDREENIHAVAEYVGRIAGKG